MLKNDIWIKKMIKNHGMIEPFAPDLVKKGKISYGISSFGYDFRIHEEFLIPDSTKEPNVIDPKRPHEDLYKKHHGSNCLIPPSSYVLARSLEYFRIPRNILGLCFGKSTYARCGIIVNVTPLEPEWEGFITFSIANIGPLPVRIYAGEGIAQIIFLEGPSPKVSYSDRKGKYQKQDTLTLPKI